MQNRYAGDIGDFSKLGLLRQLRKTGLSIGLNWYLTPDETHNTDGRFTQYLEKPEFHDIDEDLWHSLGKIVGEDWRSVEALEIAFPQLAVYYHEMLDFRGTDRNTRPEIRAKWQENALDKLKKCRIIYVDPDNGLMVPSAAKTKRSNKYVLMQELSDYYHGGANVIYYQHKARRPDDFYMNQHRQLLDSGSFPGAAGLGLKFVPTSQRFYFFILQPEHRKLILDCVKNMMRTEWCRLFCVVFPPDEETGRRI